MQDDISRPVVAGPSHTINAFCKLESISRAHLYELWKRGRGPAYYCIGPNDTYRRITEEARVEWRRRLESETGGAE